MKAKELMTRVAERLRPDASFAEARARLRALNRTWLPVCEGERLVGVLTRQDLALAPERELSDALHLPVRDLLSPDIQYCFEDTDVDEAVHLMRKSGKEALPVLNRSKRLVGVLPLHAAGSATEAGSG
jgi:CBS domain-containing protein